VRNEMPDSWSALEKSVILAAGLLAVLFPFMASALFSGTMAPPPGRAGTGRRFTIGPPEKIAFPTEMVVYHLKEFRPAYRQLRMMSSGARRGL